MFGTDKTPCDPNPCKNEGVCAQDGFTATCGCVGYYTGDTCEEGKNCLNVWYLLLEGLVIMTFTFECADILYMAYFQSEMILVSFQIILARIMVYVLLVKTERYPRLYLYIKTKHKSTIKPDELSNRKTDWDAYLTINVLTVLLNFLV